MRKPLPEITVDWLLARVVERDGCLIWTGQADNGGRDPRSSIDGVKFYVRRAIWSAMHDGRQPPKGSHIGVTCNQHCCVDPAHVSGRSASAALKGRAKSIAHRAKIAATKRAQSDLKQEKVAEILLSPLKGEDEAARHGISKSMVNLIRAGKQRRDYSSPFAMLGGA